MPMNSDFIFYEFLTKPCLKTFPLSSPRLNEWTQVGFSTKKLKPVWSVKIGLCDSPGVELPTRRLLMRNNCDWPEGFSLVKIYPLITWLGFTVLTVPFPGHPTPFQVPLPGHPASFPGLTSRSHSLTPRPFSFYSKVGERLFFSLVKGERTRAWERGCGNKGIGVRLQFLSLECF